MGEAAFVNLVKSKLEAEFKRDVRFKNKARGIKFVPKLYYHSNDTFQVELYPFVKFSKDEDIRNACKDLGEFLSSTLVDDGFSSDLFVFDKCFVTPRASAKVPMRFYDFANFCATKKWRMFDGADRFFFNVLVDNRRVGGSAVMPSAIIYNFYSNTGLFSCVSFCIANGFDINEELLAYYSCSHMNYVMPI